jgi:hypothetical protein
MKPLPLTEGTLLIDNSTIELITTCPRRYEYSSLEKKRLAEERPALSFGTAIHEALSVRYLHGAEFIDGPKIEEKQVAVLTNHFAANTPPDGDHRGLNLAVECIQQYNRAYPSEPFTVAELSGKPAIEIPFVLPLTTLRSDRLGEVPILYTGRIDMVVLEDNQIYVLDHKTTSILGTSFFEERSVDPAQHGYVWAVGEASGLPINGYIINAIAVRRPTKTGKSLEFQRQKYYTTPAQINEWRENLCLLLEELIWHYDRAKMPQKKKWCISKYGRCEFFDVCSLPYDQRPTMLESGMYIENTWSPLHKP